MSKELRESYIQAVVDCLNSAPDEAIRVVYAFTRAYTRAYQSGTASGR